MRKALFLLVFIVSTLFSFSQNNGQFFENNVLRIIYVGYTNQNHTFSVTNKSLCDVTIKVDRIGNFQSYTIGPQQSIMLFVFSQNYETQTKIKVKREGGPSCGSNPDNGWIELESPSVVLSNDYIRIISCHRTNDSKIRVVFKISTIKNIKEIRVKTSNDAKSFKTIKVIPIKNTDYYEIYL